MELDRLGGGEDLGGETMIRYNEWKKLFQKNEMTTKDK